MRTRTVIVIIAIVVIAFLALGGTLGVMAMTHSGWMSNNYGPGMMNGQQQEYSGMMDGQYDGNGGTMMGGTGQTGTQQGTAVTGVTRMNMQNFAFQYTNIQVHVGTTVTWTNQDSAPHSVTFQNGMKDSGLLNQGQSFSYTFNTPGTYQYYCTVHPNMVATVTVVS